MIRNYLSLNRASPWLLAAIALAVIGALTPLSDPRAQTPSSLQQRLNQAAAQHGGTVALDPKATVRLSRGLVVPAGVTLDLAGGTLVFTLAGVNDAGVRLMSHSAIRNGTVRVLSVGNPGTQAGIHAPVLVGELYGSGGSPRNPSPFVSPQGWTVSGVTLSSDKAVRNEEGNILGAVGLAVVGDAHSGVIENVTIPDSPVMAGGIQLDWGTVGPITSRDIADSARAFRAGLAYTTHPHDISIRNVVIGRLSRPARAGNGSFGIRLSGADHIRIDGVRIASVTEAGFLHTAGDLGYEFARPADRARAHFGIVLSNLTLDDADGAYLVRSDSNADNINRASQSGYRYLLPPIARTDIVISHVTGRAGTRRPVNFGIRVDHQRGGTITDVTAIGFRRGFYIDEQVSELTLVRPDARNSAEAGISIEHPLRPPSAITVEDARLSGSSRAAQTLMIGRSDDVKVAGLPGALVRVKREAGRTSIAAGTQVTRD